MTDNSQGTTSQPPMRPFFIIWSGQAISLLGSALVQFALIWWLTRTTGSATVLALASLAGLLPQILIAPLAGAVVDRARRKWVMVAADSIIAVMTGILAVLFWAHLQSIGLVYLLLFVRSAAGAFHWPAMQASTTLMVPLKHLPRVAGLNQTLGGMVSILIPPLGALAVETLPMPAVLAIDVATALPAVLCLLLIAIPQPPRSIGQVSATGSPGQRWRIIGQDFREGLDFVLSWKGLMLLALIGTLINILGQAAGAMIPLLIVKHFQGGAAQLGWAQSISGVGVVLGGIALGVTAGFKRKVITQMVCLILDGLAIIGFALCPITLFSFLLALFFISGFLEAIAIGIGGALAQILIPPAMQGRVFALSITLTQALAPLGLLIAGPAADQFGIPVWYIITGTVLVAIGMGGLLTPTIAQIEKHAAHPQLERFVQSAKAV